MSNSAGELYALLAFTPLTRVFFIFLHSFCVLRLWSSRIVLRVGRNERTVAPGWRRHTFRFTSIDLPCKSRCATICWIFRFILFLRGCLIGRSPVRGRHDARSDRCWKGTPDTGVTKALTR